MSDILTWHVPHADVVVFAGPRAVAGRSLARRSSWRSSADQVDRPEVAELKAAEQDRN